MFKNEKGKKKLNNTTFNAHILVQINLNIKTVNKKPQRIILKIHFLFCYLIHIYIYMFYYTFFLRHRVFRKNNFAVRENL